MEQETKFVYYMKNFYSLPEDLKSDIVYCQRALRSFIKVHQMVVDVFEKQRDADPVQKQRILDELSSDMMEINAEQQFLLLRLNDNLDGFYEFVSCKGVEIEQAFAKTFISSLIVPLVCDMKYIAQPKTVKPRPNVNALIRKYFLLSSDSTDSNIANVNVDFEAELELTGLATGNAGANFPLPPSSPPISIVSLSDDDVHIVENVVEKSDPVRGLAEELNQIIIDDDSDEECVEVVESILYPSQPQPPSRNEAKKSAAARRLNSAASKMSKRCRKTKQQPRNFEDDEVANIELNSLTFPKSVHGAGFFPRDPLDNSQSDPTQAAFLSKPQNLKKLAKTNQQKNTNASQKKKNVGVVKKKAAAAGAGETANGKPATNNNNNNKKKTGKLSGKKANNSNGLSTSSSSSASKNTSGAESNIFSSDESAIEQRQSSEPVERRCLPMEYGQEAFLGMFELFTPPALAVMQQRRSKRQRRNIHTTERSDFHYERFELMQADGSKKKNKEFLLSPKVKRMRAKKGNNAPTATATVTAATATVTAATATVTAATATAATATATVTAGASAKATAVYNKRFIPEEMGEEPSTSTGLSRSQYLVVPRRVAKPPANDKFICKECLKDHEPLMPCSVCDQMFHQECHEDGGKPHPHIKCPSCYANWKTQMLKSIHKQKHGPHKRYNFKGYGNRKGGGGGGGAAGGAGGGPVYAK